MRVLFVTTHKYLPELRGGMEVNTHELAGELIKTGHAVGVLCGLAGTGWIGLLARVRIKIFRNPCPRDAILGYSTWRAWHSVEHVAQVVKQFQPDVIVVQGGADVVALLEAALQLQIPVFYYIHTPDTLALPPALSADRNLFFMTNSLFTASVHREQVVSAVVRPLIKRENYATVSDRSAVVFINPAPHKGLEVVLGLAAGRPDVTFIFVVNRSSGIATLQEKVDLTRYPNIQLLGPLSDMRQAYSKARLILAPSQWVETWGRIATEAHFSGIPVLASDRGGLPEAVGPGGVCIAAEADGSTWLAAFAKIWDDPVLYEELVVASRTYAERLEIDRNFITTSFVEALTNQQKSQPAAIANIKVATH